jgi:hypothetical protein
MNKMAAVLVLIIALFLSSLTYGMEIRANMVVERQKGDVVTLISTDGELFVFTVEDHQFKKGDPVTAVFQVIYKGGKNESFEVVGGFLDFK